MTSAVSFASLLLSYLRPAGLTSKDGRRRRGLKRTTMELLGRDNDSLEPDPYYAYNTMRE